MQNVFSLLIYVFLGQSVSARITKRHQEDEHHHPKFCDDGKTGIEIDLHGESDWKCMENRQWTQDEIQLHPPNKKCYSRQRAFHQCIDKQIDNLYTKDVIPNSGPHRTVWATYGEYLYVPPGRYVHNLEHGGVVFMYHPCAPAAMIDLLRGLATSCTWKYLLTAYPKLTKEYPIAVLTYGCVYKMTDINANDVRAWIRKTIKGSPELNVFGQGHYNHSLVKISNRPTERSRPFCKDVPKTTTVTSTTTFPTTTTQITQGTSVELNSSVPEMAKSGSVPVSPNGSKNANKPPPTPRNNEVFWAVGSLTFLFVLLVSALCYTKLWRHRNSQGSPTAKLWHDGDAEGTMSIRALVDKFPHLFKGKLSKNVASMRANRYTLIEDEDGSDMEI